MAVIFVRKIDEMKTSFCLVAECVGRTCSTVENTCVMEVCILCLAERWQMSNTSYGGDERARCVTRDFVRRIFLFLLGLSDVSGDGQQF